MAFAGLKKQISKANQFVNEKIGGAEGTKFDDDFVDMEKKTDLTYELVDDIQNKTREYLQPNPTARAKMAAVKGISKLSGQAKTSTYPQPEGTLGEAMINHGRKLGDHDVFGQALMETGESLKQMAEVKYALDDNVKQQFLEPLHHLQTKDLKEVMHHRKKLQGRRLDYDCKKRKVMSKGAGGNAVTEEDLRLAEDKFAESLHLAQMGMHNLLENDVEQVSQLSSFAESMYEYHQQCAQILQSLCRTLEEKKREAASKPKRDYNPKSLRDLLPNDSLHHSQQSLHMNNNGTAAPPPPPYFHGNSSANHNNHTQNNHNNFPTAPAISAPAPTLYPSVNNFNNKPMSSTSNGNSKPMCKALYDFEPENPGELGFGEGDQIELVSRIDENWYEGRVHGRVGYFPVSYVQVVSPLP